MAKFIIDLLAGLSPPALIGILLFTMLNFLVPDRFIDKINIAKLDKKTARKLWFLMIGSFSLLVGILAVDVYSTALKPFYDDYSQKSNLEKRVEKLTIDEANVLKPFIEGKTLTRSIHIRDKIGAIDTLERDKVIFLINENKEIHYWTYNIERWAYFYLLEHPELLKPPT